MVFEIKACDKFTASAQEEAALGLVCRYAEDPIGG